MSDDPIVTETRAARDRLVARFDGDLDALWNHLQDVQKQLGDRIVRRAPKVPVVTSRKIS
jgi:Ethanolamine utilization protein EutJ (predicted chaperonin)